MNGATPATEPPKTLPERMQPVKRILNDIELDGLSTPELLAILLWTGTRQDEVVAAYNLLNKTNGDLLMLRRYTREEMLALGLSESRVARLRAILELENRLTVPTYEDLPKITNPSEAARMMLARLHAADQEHAITMSLDNELHILGIDTVAIGDPSTVTMRLADLLAPAIRHKAIHMIVFHNHPQGNPEPSAQDLAVTVELLTLGDMLGIKLLDHVIIGQGRYVSLSERGQVKRM